MSIPQKDGRQESPDKWLLEAIPDNERALGVLWNIGNDKLEYQVHMKEKPLTRRAMLSSLSSIYEPFGLAVPFKLEGRKIIQCLCRQNIDWHAQIQDNMAKK